MQDPVTRCRYGIHLQDPGTESRYKIRVQETRLDLNIPGARFLSGKETGRGTETCYDDFSAKRSHILSDCGESGTVCMYG